MGVNHDSSATPSSIKAPRALYSPIHLSSPPQSIQKASAICAHLRFTTIYPSPQTRFIGKGIPEYGSQGCVLTGV